VDQQAPEPIELEGGDLVARGSLDRFRLAGPGHRRNEGIQRPTRRVYSSYSAPNCSRRVGSS